MLDGVRREKLRIDGSGLELALLDWGGDGPPVLLHHANGFCAAMWDPVARGLREHFRVYAMDARGHGDSDKPAATPEAYQWRHFSREARAVAEAITARHGEIALGIGHSFGGTTLTLAAIAHPGLFGRLLLLDPVIFPSDRETRERLSRGNVLAAGARRRRNLWDTRAEAREKWARTVTFAEWQPEALDLYVDEGLADRPDGKVELKCPRDVEAAIFEAGPSLDAMDLLEKLDAPTVLVWASRGNFPRAHFEAIAALIPRCELRELPTGHFVPMEDPAAVVREAQRSTG